MKIKSFFAMLVAATALSVCVASCDKDDDKDSDSKPELKPVSDFIVGQYEGDFEVEIFGQKVPSKEVIEVKKVGDALVSFVIPSITYQTNTIPAIPVDSVHLSLDESSQVIGGLKDTVSGTVVVDGEEKSYLLTHVSISLKDESNLSIVFTEKYGKIPADMGCTFEGTKK